MAETIVDGTLFNCNNIKYTSIKANDKGGKSLNILNKNTNMGLRLTTPLMLTWGASDFVNTEGTGNGKYEMSLQFPQDEYANDDCNSFLKNLIGLEKKIKEDALIYSKDWFGKTHKSIDIIEELFTPMLKYTKIKGTSEFDYNKKPTLRLKIPQWDNAWKCEIYDEDGETLFPNKENQNISPLDYLKKGVMLAAVIQCGGIWFTNGKFTVTWKLLQAVVQKPKASINGQCLIKLKASDKEKLKTIEPVEVEDDNMVGARVEESDDEEQVSKPVLVPVLNPVPDPDPIVEEKVLDLSQEVQQELDGLVNKPKEVKKKIVRKKTVEEA
jgi:hypothetical protein